MITETLRWIAVLVIAFFVGKLMTKIKMPAILGWLIVGIVFGPHGVGLLPQTVLKAQWYKILILWMQCAFGLMLGTELIWKKLKSYGKALVVTTLSQSLGTFCLVSLAFAIVFALSNVPLYLALVFGKSEHGCAACLSHHLYHENARHYWIIGEMSLEPEFLGSHCFIRNHTLSRL